jgi:xylulokinase
VDTYLGLDIGTSAVKALLVDGAQRVVAVESAPLDVLRSRPMWSEQDPGQWWQATLTAIARLREAAPEGWRGLRGIGLSGQMHGATLLDGSGRVLRPAILWNDGRSGAECAELQRSVPAFTALSGNIAMPGFTAPKLLWVWHHEPEIFAATRKVLLPKDYVRYRLTGDFVSEMSDAAGTLWLNVAKRAWDDTLLAACGLDRSYMPDLVEGSQVSGILTPQLAAAWGLDAVKVPVAGGGGDNAASAIGIGAVRAGEGFLSLGTSGVVFAVTDRFIAAPERTLHAFCHAVPGRWHGMGVILAAASSLSWVASLVGSSDVGALLQRVEAWAGQPAPRVNAPLFLPYITGERTPHNDPEATGLFAGLRAEHGPEALVYAVLEGVAFALADSFAVLQDAGAALQHCMMVGGGARSAFWGQMIADVLRLQLHLPEGAETGAALGAARLGMLAADAGDEDAICTRPPIRQVFTPNATASDMYASRLARYRALYPAEVSTRSISA